MTKHPEIFAALAAPFAAAEVKEKEAGAGRRVKYITARTAANRLDFVLGPENWEDDYEDAAGDAARCFLTIRLPDGSKVTKSDAGTGKDPKASHSDAFKRASQKFGIARYLYRDGVPSYSTAAAAKETTPAPAPATVPLDQSDADALTREIENRPRGGFSPQTGAELCGWIKKREREYPGIMQRLHKWAAKAQLPVQMLGWDAETVRRAHRVVKAAIDEVDRERQGLGPAQTSASQATPVPTGSSGAYSHSQSNGKH